MVMIRPATIQDAAEVTEMWYLMNKEIIKDKVLFLEESNISKMLKHVVKHICEDDRFVAVYEKDNKVVGFILGDVGFSNVGFDGLCGYCELLYVKDEYRDGKIYKELIKVATKWAIEKGICAMRVTGMYGEKTNSLFVRMGYIPTCITYRKRV